MRALALISIILLASVIRGMGNDAGNPVSPPVRVDFFFEQGCESCAEIKRDIVPELDRRYAGAYELHPWDINIQSNYLRLVVFQDRLGVTANEPVSMVVDGRVFLAGLAKIKTDVFGEMEAALARRMREELPPPVPAISPASAPLLKQRLESFTLMGVVWAAVVDSINPCAISSLVFFMSLLSVANIGVRRMGLAGVSFLVACFITYMAMGFGLLKILEFLTAFHGVKRIIELLLMVMMLVFAFLSFRDAFRYHRTGRSEDVSLKLPAALQARIHRVMKTGLRRRNLIVGGLGIGVSVTLLESVCTGQVYVPVLVMMIKSGQSMLRSALYLCLYNVIFVLPLAIVLALTCAGMSTPALVNWSRKNVTISKILLGVFFLVMTALMLALR